ncbi:MAG TPA: YlbF family regulator [Phycisphaerae bacterium]|jgi:cell fate (sporulation/competence/biofilm development) regulator YlbF (YheA/YmcA/DUF963 family)|nr:YlbF family regulator [Phycisphaerae bacterium]
MQAATELLEKARELGEALARHERVRAYLAAQQAVRQDEQAQTLLRDYARHVDHLRELEASRRPIEVADKHKAADLEAHIAGNARLKELMRMQADYVELINQVNQAIAAPLNPPPQPPGGPA